jgi:hypothetical protein
MVLLHYGELVDKSEVSFSKCEFVNEVTIKLAKTSYRSTARLCETSRVALGSLKSNNLQAVDSRQGNSLVSTTNVRPMPSLDSQER